MTSCQTGESRSPAEELVSWWKRHGRRYPWRETSDPYKILVAEILLHRTRADQVVPVYHRFLSRFPTVKKLALASEEKVLDTIRSLGLAWRVPLMIRMARRIVETTGGKICDDRDWLLSLPGVSDYTASAIMCFAFGHRVSLLDTNTVRILGRISGMSINDGSRRSKAFHRAYLDLMSESSPREFGYAMIDLGALVCTARSPRCDICPFRTICNSLNE